MSINDEIKALADKYRQELKTKIDKRIAEMEGDDKSHFLIYRILGVEKEEGQKIDEYQNKGRFLYRSVGSFLEEAVMKCFKSKFLDAKRIRIENTSGTTPKRFEIDCLVGNDAIEIKWRDATTDGDHINKEEMRVESIHKAGYRPIRLMFFRPNREQAIEIQEKLKELYEDKKGLYYSGEDAWNYVHEKTGVDLLKIMNELVDENVQSQ